MWIWSSIGAEHWQVLLPILRFTPFVATLLLLARSLTEFLPYVIGTFDFVGSRVYGYLAHFSTLVILSIFDSVLDGGRDSLDDILPNQMIRKLNLILLLIVWWSLYEVMQFSNLTVWKNRFIMAGSHKYRQNVWNILDTFPQYWWSVEVHLFC